MRESKTIVRYMGYRSLPDGGRQFDFSVAMENASPMLIQIDAPVEVFRGPAHIAVQEAPGICFETLKLRIETDVAAPPDHFDLTPVDIAQHRKMPKGSASRSEIRKEL